MSLLPFLHLLGLILPYIYIKKDHNEGGNSIPENPAALIYTWSDYIDLALADHVA